MANVNQFVNALDDLFRKRTYKLRSKIGSKILGQPPKITRKSIKKEISNLQEIASHVLANKLVKTEFKKHTHKKKAWHVKGHGVDEKKKVFEKWFIKEFPILKSCVYLFWGNKKCIYVGRTGRGGSRPSDHFKIHWFKDVNRIDIFQFTSKSQTPKLECLAIHHFDPRENKKKSATKKWTKRCPLCAIHKDIEKELRKIFKLKESASYNTLYLLG